MATKRIIEHYIFSTKYRLPLLTNNVSKECLFELIRQIEKIGCSKIDIAVEPDHVHLLISRPEEIPTRKVAELVKSGTSRKLRQMFPELKEKSPNALWAKKYYSVLVKEKELRRVQNYIQNQKLAALASCVPLNKTDGAENNGGN